MSEWTVIKLKGKSQVIPKVCPSCLAPADHEFRYGYKGLKGWLTRTTYYQSFHYCEPCWKQAKSALGLGTWTFVLVLFGAFSTLILAAAIAGTSRNPENQDSGPGVLLLLAPAALLAAFAGLFLLIRGVKRRRYPLRESQVAWGPAAFYVGSGFLDVQGHSTYKALRREWVALLVKANPEQVDDETYQAFANAPKPSPSPGTRPFGGS